MNPQTKWECVTYSQDGQVILVECIPTEGHEESIHCWCEPDIMMDCGECEMDDETCWKCGGVGLVEHDRWSGQIPIVVHYEEEE